jgi:hypothetical protein
MNDQKQNHKKDLGYRKWLIHQIAHAKSGDRLWLLKKDDREREKLLPR